MTSNTSYANLDSREGNLNGELAITFAFRPRKIIITNDTGNADLQFRFSEDGQWARLKPTETVTLEMGSKNMYIQGTNVAYRIWGIG